MSGMPEHKGGQEGRATDGSRMGGLTPRAHLLWLRVSGGEGQRHSSQDLERNIAEEDIAVAAGGRQGTAGSRENPFSVRGDHGRITAHGS